jgi:hypothetical protein
MCPKLYGQGGVHEYKIANREICVAGARRNITRHAAADTSRRKARPTGSLSTLPRCLGREMPIPKEATGLISVGGPSLGVFEGPDGQIFIEVNYRQSADGNGGELTKFLCDFFSGRVVKIWRTKFGDNSGIKAKRAFLETKGYRKLKDIVNDPYQDKIRLSDGSYFDIINDYKYMYSRGIRRFDASGRVLAHWVVIHFSGRTYYYHNHPHFPLVAGRDYLHFRSLEVTPQLVPLRDGTFLMTCDQRPVSIRFRGNLTSPYIKRSGNILLIEPKKAFMMFRKSWQEAVNILWRLRKQIPNLPEMDQEIVDEFMVSKLKKLINQRRGPVK